jgi:L-ascorbate metabolism protein UlaG (beta-lactamase superfamily)
MKYCLLLLVMCVFSASTFSQTDSIKTENGSLAIYPVQHASMVLYAQQLTVYIDPVGGAALYSKFRKPDYILITDIHGDHMDPKTVDSIKSANTIIIAPQAVADKLNLPDASRLRVLSNGEETEYHGISIQAIPMYNLPESQDSRHTKGRGNGYLITLAGKRLYVSGDTEDIPEMRQLKKIDAAFVCMNLPYTMDVKQAADAVLAFKPGIVYPYHYRGQGGLSDINEFKQIVNNKNSKIDVRLLDWYPTN